MKPGDILVDKEGKRWLLYDVLGSYLCVTDPETQTVNDVRLVDEIEDVELKPENVTYMLIFKHNRNLKDVEEFLCS